MPDPKTFKWTIEIEVAECWIVDGFDMSDEHNLQFITERLVSYAREGEVKARVLKAPSTSALSIARGELQPKGT